MNVYVGTSGWAYDWNPDGFKWYVGRSGLNAIELNASFYRFPFPSQVKGWSRISKGRIRWSVKVSRLITHVFKLGERAKGTWEKFYRLMEPLNPDFYLFQLPPILRPTDKFLRRLEEFHRFTGIGERFAVEGRHVSWFTSKMERWCNERNMVLVSVDAPDLPRELLMSRGKLYLRMHGRTFWYAHAYTEEELSEIARSIVERMPNECYVFFNNDTDMLGNARLMMKIFKNLIGNRYNVFGSW